MSASVPPWVEGSGRREGGGGVETSPWTGRPTRGECAGPAASRYGGSVVALPFSREAFFGVFRAYNEAVWPAQWVLYGLALVCLVLVVRRPREADRAKLALRDPDGYYVMVSALAPA